MSRPWTAHTSYANVMSTVAIFVALGGTSYAAIELPKNSVQSRHLATGAVTSSDVKDGSLTRRDFKRGELAAASAAIQALPGPPGPAGIAGPPGQPGSSGAPGQAGARGLDALQYFAVIDVNAAGEVTGRRGSATSTFQRKPDWVPGKVRVDFPTDVSDCAYIATLQGNGDDARAATAPDQVPSKLGEIDARASHLTPKGVIVETGNSSGRTITRTNADGTTSSENVGQRAARSFNLEVIC